MFHTHTHVQLPYIAITPPFPDTQISYLSGFNQNKMPSSHKTFVPDQFQWLQSILRTSCGAQMFAAATLCAPNFANVSHWSKVTFSSDLPCWVCNLGVIGPYFPADECEYLLIRVWLARVAFPVLPHVGARGAEEAGCGLRVRWDNFEQESIGFWNVNTSWGPQTPAFKRADTSGCGAWAPGAMQQQCLGALVPQKSHRRFCTVAYLLRRNGFGVGLIAVPLFFEAMWIFRIIVSNHLFQGKST